MSSLWVHQWDGAPLHHPRSPDWASERRWLRWDGVSGSFAHEVEGDTCRGLRVGFEEMGERSRRRIRDLVTQLAFKGLSENEIGCARISMMARSNSLHQRAGYRRARPVTATLQIPLATHGRSIQMGQRPARLLAPETFDQCPHLYRFRA